MIKNTVTGSILAKLFPGMSKFFLENASQEQVNQAEQEAAVIHQQLQSLETPTTQADPAAPTASPAPTNPTPAAVEVPAAPTAPATPSAEDQVKQLTAQVSTLTKERDQYKAWYEKQAGAGKTLPKQDASDMPLSGLSAYESDALQAWRESH